MIMNEDIKLVINKNTSKLVVDLFGEIIEEELTREATIINNKNEQFDVLIKIITTLNKESLDHIILSREIHILVEERNTKNGK